MALNEINKMDEINKLDYTNPVNSLGSCDNPVKVKGKSGRPRKYPIDPLLGKTNYKLLVHDVRNSTRITCPNCHIEIMQCNLSHHKKTKRCKLLGENIYLKTINNVT